LDGFPDNLLHKALALAELGYRVFPCRPRLKVPATEHGVLDATDDPAVIDRWWALWPKANIGLATDGLLVVDVDGADNPWLADQPERFMDLSAAPLSLTAHGGRQYFFRQAEGGNLRNTTARIAPRIDTRANGGYVVAPTVGIGGWIGIPLGGDAGAGDTARTNAVAAGVAAGSP
jgi:hypothetical protein